MGPPARPLTPGRRSCSSGCAMWGTHNDGGRAPQRQEGAPGTPSKAAPVKKATWAALLQLGHVTKKARREAGGFNYVDVEHDADTVAILALPAVVAVDAMEAIRMGGRVGQAYRTPGSRTCHRRSSCGARQRCGGSADGGSARTNCSLARRRSPLGAQRRRLGEGLPQLGPAPAEPLAAAAPPGRRPPPRRGGLHRAACCVALLAEGGQRGHVRAGGESFIVIAASLTHPTPPPARGRPRRPPRAPRSRPPRAAFCFCPCGPEPRPRPTLARPAA